jgi:hypothetical protein
MTPVCPDPGRGSSVDPARRLAAAQTWRVAVRRLKYVLLLSFASGGANRRTGTDYTVGPEGTRAPRLAEPRQLRVTLSWGL